MSNKESLSRGLLTIENVPAALSTSMSIHDLCGAVVDFGLQTSVDGRIWINVDGITFARFKPIEPKEWPFHLLSDELASKDVVYRVVQELMDENGWDYPTGDSKADEENGTAEDLRQAYSQVTWTIRHLIDAIKAEKSEKELREPEKYGEES